MKVQGMLVHQVIIEPENVIQNLIDAEIGEGSEIVFDDENNQCWVHTNCKLRPNYKCSEETAKYVANLYEVLNYLRLKT